MRRWSADELRERFLSFFEAKGHLRVASASLIPHADPTLLLTGAGMVPFKPYFLGQAEPERRRMTSCQRCLRTGDIDQVGLTDRHATFFEMLGNFSFGDYFKREAITWAWEFVTEHLELPADRLWVSVYVDDDEAVDIWTQVVGIAPERVVRLGKEDNFWEIGVGPCGPCSELYFDRGAEHGCGDAQCAPGCDCDRFVEFWNLVFIQFHRDESGNYSPLERTGIDTGMGLERMAAILQGARSIFDIDLIRPLLDYVARRAGVEYRESPETDVSLRVITDHMRGVTFLIHDGVVPSNEGRGYVLRRLLRRAVRHARLLGIEDPFLAELVDVVVRQMAPGYPELAQSQSRIKDIVAREEARFDETLGQGMDMLETLMADLEREGQSVLPGDAAFRMYDTYGFPLELTEEIARGRQLTVDVEGFHAAMERQRARARAARARTGYMGENSTDRFGDLPEGIQTTFEGYTRTKLATRVVYLGSDGRSMDRVEPGTRVEVVLAETPFYPVGGGQVADRGTITGRFGQIDVEHVHTPLEGVIVHEGTLVGGPMEAGEQVLATVDDVARHDTARHHTATHLLHQALRDVLGEHAGQAGSLVAPDRLRFDFSHYEPVSPEQLRTLERKVNQIILADVPVKAEELPMEEAKKQGALMLFGEKYGDVVRVVSIGDYSKELCGGTHVGSTGALGLFKVVSEGGVAAGIRRIEAVAGYRALERVERQEDALIEAAKRLKVAPFDVPRQVQQLLEQLKQAQREIETVQRRLIESQLDTFLAAVETVGDVSVVAVKAPQGDAEALRTLGDRLRDKLRDGVVILAGTEGDRVTLIGMADKGAVEKGVHVGTALRAAAPLVGGGGGGRADMAQAGGRDPDGIEAALDAAKASVREQLGVLHGSV